MTQPTDLIQENLDNGLTPPQTQYLYREPYNPKNVNGNNVLMKMGKGAGAPEYLQVPHRLHWINHDAPLVRYTSFTIDLDRIEFFNYVGASGKDVRGCWVMCTVTLFDEQGNVLKRATDVGSETHTDFADYIEKAVTKAKGRALANIGFGTQFAVADFDEGQKPSPLDGQVGQALADAPIRTAAPAAAPAAPASAPARPAPAAAPAATPATFTLTPAAPTAPAADPGFDRASALAELQAMASKPAVAQLLSQAVTRYAPEGNRVSNLTDDQLCEVYKASNQSAA